MVNPPNLDGEQAMTMNDMQNLAPETMSPKGQKQVGSMINTAQKAKPELDNMFKLVAAQEGLDPNQDFQSRVKQSDTIVRKVAKHRKDKPDKNYRLDDVNDVFGGRYIAKTPDQKHAVIDAIDELDKNHNIRILKTENVHSKTYHAYHIDFIKDGVRGEIQIHDPGSLFEAVVNHDIRAKYGDNPPPQIEEHNKAISKLGYSLPQYQAQQIATAIEKQRQGGI